MAYSVYKHTFPNGKIYIGITGQIPEIRWNNGYGYLSKSNGKYNQPIMARAILKYGWNNIKHEILFDGLSKEESEQKEMELIIINKSNNRKFGYNIANGGNASPTYGRSLSEEHKQRISASRKGEKNWMYGKHHSEEHRQKISSTLKGHVQSEEMKRKLGKPVRCIETGKTYYSMEYAGKKVGIDRSSISKACSGRIKVAGGYHWEYVE